VVVLHVHFLHNEQLIAQGCKVNPPVMVPRQQLTICKRKALSKLRESLVQLWWSLAA
jgi:hypothetical protein